MTLVKSGRKAAPIDGTGGAPDVTVGQWYWLRVKNDRGGGEHRRLTCVTHLGSNYVELTGPGKWQQEWRIHAHQFQDLATLEPEAETILRQHVAQHQEEVRRLMGEVREVTARLSVGIRQAVTDGSETQALTTAAANPKEYEQALVLAKEKTLPELFEKIKRENEMVATWMTATLIPLQAEASALQPAMAAIKDRIFGVQLYAGLSETVVQVRGGAPAALAEPIHLFQRRHYMDEECLARYEAGGMEFKDLAAFDAWLARTDNRDRILPKPRCIVAFQVRRNKKEREFPSLSAWLNFALSGEGDLDKLTFLYMRNGEQVYRLKTAVEFGPQLFPDLDRTALDNAQVLYASMFAGRIEVLKTEGEVEAEERDFQARTAVYKVKLAAWKKLTMKQRKEGDYFGPSAPHRSHNTLEKWSPESVYYDDITAHVHGEIAKHNRLVTVLQGLLDRSPVFHPHAPWQLWTADGFAAGLRLVQDDARALVAGPRPDFEAYRRRLNTAIKKGTYTTGQEDYWLRREAERQNERASNSRHSGRSLTYTRYRPYGQRGPGMVALVRRWVGQAGTFEWEDERASWRRDYHRRPTVKRAVRVPVAELFNVDAYTPGDFKQFFDDPRTRAEYLQWAPLLLAAEDWHAKKTAGKPSKCADEYD